MAAASSSPQPNINVNSAGGNNTASGVNNKDTGKNNNNNGSSATSSIVDPLVAALWGVIPIHAKLFPGDIKAGATPTDKQLLVPRQGFLLYHMDSLRAHFSPFAENIHSLWLSVRDKTGIHSYIPWHVPTHVVVDRAMTRQSSGGGGVNNNSIGSGDNNNTSNNNQSAGGVNNNSLSRSANNMYQNINSETRNWGTTFLPLVVYVHFTLPPALKKKQRPDLAAIPETMLTLKDTPGITTLHLHRWLKTVYLTRFGDLVGFDHQRGLSRIDTSGAGGGGVVGGAAGGGGSPTAGGGSSGVNASFGQRVLKAAKDNDPLIFQYVKSDITKRQQNLSNQAGLTSNDTVNYCVVVHTFDGKGEKPQFRYKVCRVAPQGRTLGRTLPELLGASFEAMVPSSVLVQDDVLPPQYGSVFVQGLQPLMSTPFDVLYDVFMSVDLALHIIWRPAVAK